MLSNQCLITLPEVRTKGLVPKVRHTRLRLSVNKVEGHVGLTDGVQIAMIRDGLSRLLEARSLFAHAEVLVTNLVLDLEGDRRLLGDHQVQASDLIRADDERSSSKNEDSSN